MSRTEFKLNLLDHNEANLCREAAIEHEGVDPHTHGVVRRLNCTHLVQGLEVGGSRWREVEVRSTVRRSCVLRLQECGHGKNIGVTKWTSKLFLHILSPDSTTPCIHAHSKPIHACKVVNLIQDQSWQTTIFSAMYPANITACTQSSFLAQQSPVLRYNHTPWSCA